MTYEEAIAAVEAKSEHVGAEVIKTLKDYVPIRTREDKREASKLAAETAKMILTVDVAGLVAVGTFVQFARNGGVDWFSWTMGLFAAAALCGVVAAGAGFLAIAAIYKRAEGRSDGDKEPWSTEAPKGKLNIQALASLIALLALITGIVFLAQGSGDEKALTARSATRQFTFMISDPMSIAGTWEELQLTGSNRSTLIVGKDEGPVALECK